MKYAHIAIYIDLLFCLVIMPLIIMLAPVEKWIEHKMPFFISLVAYLYGLYFIYRKKNQIVCSCSCLRKLIAISVNVG